MKDLHITKGTRGKNDNASSAVKKRYNTPGAVKATHNGEESLHSGHTKVAMQDGQKGSQKHSRNKSFVSRKGKSDGEFKNA